jgi:hypothetical protein
MYSDKGFVTESSISNFAVQLDDKSGDWITPSEGCGLLKGVMRSELLDQGAIREGAITVDDLRRACQVSPSNAFLRIPSADPFVKPAGRKDDVFQCRQRIISCSINIAMTLPGRHPRSHPRPSSRQAQAKRKVPVRIRIRL